MIIDEFLDKISLTAKRIQAHTPDPLVTSGLHALNQAARVGDILFFTEGTVRMLAEKSAHFEETVQEVYARYGEVDISATAESIFHRGVWIVFPAPMLLEPSPPIAALFCFVPSCYVATGKDAFLLYLIDPSADVAYMLVSQPGGGVWEFEAPFHQCSLCQRKHGTILPCPSCQSTLLVWSEVFAVASIIALQYLAERRYEEKRITSTRRVPREKHAKKSRTQVMYHTVKVIDANEIILPLPQPDSSHIKEERGSWLQPALAEGNVVYKERRTRPFIRTYHHERYRESGLQGKTVEFPEGVKRMQPMLKSKGKRVTKVKASLYEQQEN